MVVVALFTLECQLLLAIALPGVHATDTLHWIPRNSQTWSHASFVCAHSDGPGMKDMVDLGLKCLGHRQVVVSRHEYTYTFTF